MKCVKIARKKKIHTGLTGNVVHVLSLNIFLAVLVDY